MEVRCECGRFDPSKSWPRQQDVSCFDCYRRHLVEHPAGTPSAPATPPVPLDCVHCGGGTSPPEGYSTTKKWIKCEKGMGIGGKQCLCICNSGCEGYEADEPELHGEAEAVD